MTTTYTKNLRLPIPDFLSEPWHAPLQAAIQAIDNAVYQSLVDQNIALWTNSTAFNQGALAIDAADGSTWICRVSHTSAVSPTTFAQDRAANSTYWASFVASMNVRGAWTHDTAYAYYDQVYDATLKIIALCITPHTSNHAGTINDDAADWAYLAVFPSVTSAVSLAYDHTTSGMAATNVQSAIDELDGRVDATETLKATIASPTFTGDPKAPTATIGDNDTSIATTAFVAAAVAAAIAAITPNTSQTGDVVLQIPTVAPTGWLMCNDQTIGNVGSGATFANASAIDLYGVLWTYVTDTFAPVTGGRGASPSADWLALKPIKLTQMLGRALGVAGTGSGLTARTLGQTVGEETHTLTPAETALHTHSATDSGHIHGNGGGASGSNNISYTAGGTTYNGVGAANTASSTANITVASNGGTTPPLGGAHNNMQPTGFLNARIKL